jgi:hypothetical protein
VRHLRAHFHPAASCAQPRPTEAAGLLPNRKASPASHFQLGRHCPEPKEAAAPLAIPRQPSNSTDQHYPLPEPRGQGRRHWAPQPTIYYSSAPLQPSSLRPEPKAVAAPLAIPYQPSNSTGHQSPHPAPTGAGLRHLAPQQTKYYSSVPLQTSCPRPEPKEAAAPLAIRRQLSNSTGQPCPHAAPTGAGLRHWARRRTMNSTALLQPGCLRSEPMEAAAPRARHPYWVLSKLVLRKQTRAQEQPRTLEAAPAGALQPGQLAEAAPRPQMVPSTRSAACPRWLRTASSV